MACHWWCPGLDLLWKFLSKLSHVTLPWLHLQGCFKPCRSQRTLATSPPKWASSTSLMRMDFKISQIKHGTQGVLGGGIAWRQQGYNWMSEGSICHILYIVIIHVGPLMSVNVPFFRGHLSTPPCSLDGGFRATDMAPTLWALHIWNAYRPWQHLEEIQHHPHEDHHLIFLWPTWQPLVLPEV